MTTIKVDKETAIYAICKYFNLQTSGIYDHQNFNVTTEKGTDVKIEFDFEDTDFIDKRDINTEECERIYLKNLGLYKKKCEHHGGISYMSKGIYCHDCETWLKKNNNEDE
ncbi:MAG: hypothetical protein GY782_08390 [Gammaproteobacteria bacterium]|nr:hypothetical protein [Gammaproteobacteria bacterium]